MYAYITKGMTVGHLLTRRLLRFITGLPGLAIDVVIALFWTPNFMAYWDEAVISYSDDVQTTPARGTFGWIGEILGYVIGAPVGFVVGLAFFAVDSLLSVTRYLQKQLYSRLDDFALFIGKARFFEGLLIISNPRNFVEKSYNIGAGTLGVVLAFIPWIIAKSLELIFPFLGKTLSSIALTLAGWAGGVVVSGCAILLYPAIYLVNRLGQLYDLAQEKFRFFIALIYAKTDTIPGVEDPRDRDVCVPNHVLHSEAFLKDVDRAKRTTWAQLIFGPLKQVEQVNPKANDDKDAITLDKLGANGLPVVVDKDGHRFNDYRNTMVQGIHFWVEGNHTCPLSRVPLNLSDLKPAKP